MPLLRSIGRALVCGAVQVQLALGAFAALSAQPVTAAASVDHRAFDAMLREHVTDGLVDYDAFAADARFPAYLASLNTVKPEALAQDDRLAFWINVYNAFTIHLINVKGERESIRNINRAFGLLKLKGPWSEPIVRAGGRTLTLDQVEHEIIRREFAEPRIHFALVCAAMGCPPLRSEAYVGTELERQLREQGRQFILTSPAKNRIDLASRTVYVSLVFTWFREDFGGNDAAIGRYLAEWFAPGPERDLLMSGRFSLKETTYDWSLNRVRPVRSRKEGTR